MSTTTLQNEFGYFGKLPTFGDFIHQTLPQDFANGFHEWLQASMAAARASLGDDFLTYYLNCPSWKFVMSPGVCGTQAVAGLTIPSVDRVGRYFNFTLATVLATDTDPIAYVMANRPGFKALELLALDILESDYPNTQMELKVRETSLQFEAISTINSEVRIETDKMGVSLNQPLPFEDQASTLLTHLIDEKLGAFSIWWYGQEGQTRSNMVACRGMPSSDTYLSLLTLEAPPQPENSELDYIDKIIAGETST
jgi:type VI secretion system protein ImpM